MTFSAKRCRISEHDVTLDRSQPNYATCFVEVQPHPLFSMSKTQQWAGVADNETRRRKQHRDDPEAGSALPQLPGPNQHASSILIPQQAAGDDDDTCSITSELSFTDMLDALEVVDLDSPAASQQHPSTTSPFALDFSFPAATETEAEAEAAPCIQQASTCSREGARRRRSSFAFTSTADHDIHSGPCSSDGLPQFPTIHLKTLGSLFVSS